MKKYNTPLTEEINVQAQMSLCETSSPKKDSFFDIGTPDDGVNAI